MAGEQGTLSTTYILAIDKQTHVQSNSWGMGVGPEIPKWFFLQKCA